MTEPATRPNADQAEYWNSAPGRKWIAHEDMLDTLLAGVQARLIARADPRPGESVLDIGCGTGATARALAERVGRDGSVLAVDISEPLLQRAREKAGGLPQLSFLLADAQTQPFEPESADLAASRFGVMFFDDPRAAFRNIRAALRPGGRVCFAAWGPAAANPWFTIPREAAVARVGSPAPQPADAPGPLAFGDRDLASRHLVEGGFAEVAAETEAIDLFWPGDFAALVSLATSLGPAARILRERGGSPEDEQAIREVIADGLSRFRGPSGVRVPASLNFLMARRA